MILGLVLVLSLFLSACYGGGGNKTEGQPKEDGGGNTSGTDAKPNVPQELKVLETSEIPGMDSVMGEDQMTFTMLNNTNEGLYRLDKDQKPVPGVAAGPAENNGKDTEFTIKLNPDAKWSNGDPVTANDFVYAWQRSLDPATASPYGPYMMIGKVLNADKVYAKKAKPDELGIKALDDHTLKITFVKPIPYFESLMAFQTFYPQNKKYVESQGKNFATNDKTLVYNGPFKLTDWDGPQDTEWGMTKNDTYWDAKNVKLDKVSFSVSKDPQASVNAYNAGEADLTGKLAQASIISQFEGSPDLQRYLEPSVWWLKMNEKNPIFKNLNIRKAVAMAVDKEALTKNVLANGSVPADYIVPAEWIKSEDGKDFREGGSYLKTNKEEATKLWKQGLKELGKSSVSVTYVGQDTETSKITDSFIKDQLEKTLPGLKVNIESVPFKIRLDRENKQDYDLLMGGWGPDYNDPMTYLDLWVTGGEQNHMDFSDPEYDKMIAAADKDGDAAHRWKTLQDAEKKLLEDDAALAPIYQRALNTLQKPKIKGLVHHDLGGEYSFQWTTIEGE
nr:peptide ABC transporter substrate-binding protein [Metabacillus kandeliae]